MTIYLARLETSNFTFAAAGSTEDKASKALIAGLRKHGKQYGIGCAWWRGYADEISVRPLVPDVTVLRDGEPI